MCHIRWCDSSTRKKREQPRGSCLGNLERVVRGEENKKGESKMLRPLREIISVCVCESKEKQERFFFSRETYTRIIVIDLIIVKLFRVCFVVFPFKKKRVFSCKYLCSYSWLLFWITNICDNIIWYPTVWVPWFSSMLGIELMGQWFCPGGRTLHLLRCCIKGRITWKLNERSMHEQKCYFKINF